MVEWAGHAAYFGAGIYVLRQAGVCTPGQDFQRPSVQPASECRVPQAGGRVQAHAGDGGEHRGTEAPGAGGTGGVSASGHGASGRLGRRQGGLPYQCRGRGNAMAGGGVRKPDQRSLSAAGAGGDPTPVSVPHPGFPLRQRIGVHQPGRSEAAGEAADRVHQKPCEPQSGQRPGRGQERRRHPQADGLRTHRRRTRRSAAEVLHGTLEWVSELSSSVRVRDGKLRRTGQKKEELPGRGLCHAVRETQESPRRSRLPQRECQLRMVGSTSEPHQRYGVREEDGDGQSQPAEEGQERIADTAAVPLNLKAKGCERRTGPGSRADLAPLADAAFSGGRREGKTGGQESRHVRCLPPVCAAAYSGKTDLNTFNKQDLKIFNPATMTSQREQPDKTQNLPIKESQNTRGSRRASRWSASRVQKPRKRSAGGPPPISSDFMIIFRLENALPFALRAFTLRLAGCRGRQPAWSASYQQLRTGTQVDKLPTIEHLQAVNALAGRRIGCYEL